MLVPINSIVTFVANGEPQKFITEMDCDIDMIEETILEWFTDYREESLCINGINYQYPNITSGYMVIEGKIGESLANEKKETWLSLQNTRKVLSYGLRKGDILNLKGVSSLRVTEVDYGNQLLCVSFE